MSKSPLLRIRIIPTRPRSKASGALAHLRSLLLHRLWDTAVANPLCGFVCSPRSHGKTTHHPHGFRCTLRSRPMGSGSLNASDVNRQPIKHICQLSPRTEALTIVCAKAPAMQLGLPRRWNQLCSQGAAQPHLHRPSSSPQTHRACASAVLRLHCLRFRFFAPFSFCCTSETAASHAPAAAVAESLLVCSPSSSESFKLTRYFSKVVFGCAHLTPAQ